MDKVFIAGISGVRQYFQSVHSWENMARRPGDVLFWQSTNVGEIGRQIVVEKFLQSDCDRLMMCDLDQEFPMNTLEVLRAHDLDMVTGHYMQRKTSSLRSNWKYTIDGGWPYIPILYRDIPREGLHRLATTGMGCVLIKRKPIEAVREYLSFWEPNSNPFEIGKVHEEATFYGTWGSDTRFFYYAQRLGFELWGDASIETPHASNIWVTRDIHEQFLPNAERDAKMLNEDVFVATIATKGVITLNALHARKRAIEVVRETLDDRSDQAKVLDGQLAEIELHIGLMEHHSPPPGFVERWHRDSQPALKDAPVKFPTFKSREELEDAMAHPERDIDGGEPKDTDEARKQATRNAAKSAAKILNGKQGNAA